MFDELISRATLEDFAGSTAFRRGEEYFSLGTVNRLRTADDKITAKVQGSESYQVELWNDDGELAGDCTCPRAADGYFCKHCVAAGLAWLAEQSTGQEGEAKRRDPWQDITDYLGSQTQASLIELLLEVAQRDDRLYQSLSLKAERLTGGDMARTFRRAIDGALGNAEYVGWREAPSFAAKFEQVVDALADLRKPDSAAELVELTEYAIKRAEDCVEQIDDSDGEFSGIVCRLGEMHLAACLLAKPEPVGLAEDLFRLETTLSFGFCHFDPVTYKDALGKTGLQRYRELAEAQWDAIEPRTSHQNYDSRRYTITCIMERLAEASGDVDELVAIKSRDLASAYHYLGIAEILAKAEREDEALVWAERGVKAFPERTHANLRDFLVAIYLKRQRGDEALQLTWVQFEESPGLETFKKLHDVAGKLCIWPAQRERALAWLDQSIASEATSTNRWKPKPSTPDFSPRVSIALWEKDLDAAWAAAHQGTCQRELLVTLGKQLETERPNDAISLFRRVVPPIVEQTNNSAYHEAIKLIRRIGPLMLSQQQSSQFGDYLAELRLRFKPKRNFIKLLDAIKIARSDSTTPKG